MGEPARTTNADLLDAFARAFLGKETAAPPRRPLLDRVREISRLGVVARFANAGPEGDRKRREFRAAMAGEPLFQAMLPLTTLPRKTVRDGMWLVVAWLYCAVRAAPLAQRLRRLDRTVEALTVPLTPALEAEMKAVREDAEAIVFESHYFMTAPVVKKAVLDFLTLLRLEAEAAPKGLFAQLDREIDGLLFDLRLDREFNKLRS